MLAWKAGVPETLGPEVRILPVPPNGEVAEWPNAPDCKSGSNRRAGSNPAFSTNFHGCAAIARLMWNTQNPGLKGQVSTQAQLYALVVEW